MKRSKLYDRIWSTPASKLADELGISGSRIAAICRRHSIPTPPRGHWAKWAVGKHLPQAPLPQPEADYELKLGTPPPKPSAWIAPGVLLRPEATEEPPSAAKTEPASASATLTSPAAARTEDPTPRPRVVDVDLELVRAAAAELQGLQAMRELLQAVAARAVHASPADAQRILGWTAAVRTKLAEQDPVAALARHAAAFPP